MESKKGTDTFIVAGFTLGIVAMFRNYYGIVSLLAIISSIVGLKNVNKNKGKGKNLAVAGLILGIIGITWGIYKLILLLTATTVS